jgi:hypothetical protein
MKVVFLIVLSILMGASASYGQTTATGKANTSGSCSPAVTGSKNTFVIKCGVDSAQGKRMIEILNKVLENQIDPTAVMAKLDEILQASRSSQVVNAPNGIGSIGGTLVNPTVNNFGPPTPQLTFREEIIPEVPGNNGGPQTLKVHIKTDRSIPGAFIGVSFSGEVELGEPELVGAALRQINTITRLLRNGAVVPNAYGFVINAPAAFMPGMDLLITAKSKGPVHVLAVGSVTPMSE